MPKRTEQVYQRFGEVETASGARVYASIATAFSRSTAALQVLDGAPAQNRRPALILAALHDLVLAGRAPVLAQAFCADDAEAAAGAAIEVLVSQAAAVLELAARSALRGNESGRYAVLLPAISEIAHRTGASQVGLIDVMRSAALNLNVDRVGVSYSNGQSLGDDSSPVRLSASVVGNGPLPNRAMPEVVARVGVDPDPVDVTDVAGARWLRACLRPSQQEEAGMLRAEIDLAASQPPVLLRGEVLDRMPDAFACVPAGALPVVLTTWVLKDLPLDSRLRFLHRLDEAAAGRPVAWISVEGVGVAPAVPTFGDRRASGHSVISLALLDGSQAQIEAVGRSWSQGRMLSWLAGG